MPNKKKPYYEELNIFRALIIVWVVIGHSFFAGNNILGFLHEYAYTFHMEAFFLLSGILFAPKLNRIKTPKEIKNIVLNRFERLIVAYLFFSFVSYVLKFIFERYANNKISKNIILDLLTGQNNPNGGLWFLYTLFVLSVLATFIYKVPNIASLSVFVILKAITLFTEIDIPVVSLIACYGIYFFTGIFIAKYYSKISDFILKCLRNSRITSAVICILLFAASILFTLWYIHFALQIEFVTFAVSIFNLSVWYLISAAISCTKSLKRPAMIIGNYGMDIYMIGYYVQISIRVVLISMLSLPIVPCEILMFVFGLILPIPISKYFIRRFKITRMLMLGDFS